MRGWWIAALLLSAALAGCTSDEGPEPATEQHDESLHDGQTAEQLTNVTPTPPEVGLAANLTSGQVPFNVTFEGGLVDADGDDLTWSLDVNGDQEAEAEGVAIAANGSYAPVNFTFGYVEPGVYNVTLTVTDGTHTVNASTTVNASAPEVDVVVDGEEVISFPLVVTLEVSSPCDFCYSPGFETCFSWMTNSPGDDCNWMEVPAEWIGHSYSTNGEGDVDVEWRQACSRTSYPPVESNGATGHDSGVVPEGAGCLLVADYEGTGTITVKIS